MARLCVVTACNHTVMPKEKLTKELVNEAVSLVESGATNNDVIAYLGVNQATFYRWLQSPKTPNQRELCESLKKAETKRKVWHLQRIHKAAEEGSWQASAWYLERRYPQEYGRTHRVVEGPKQEEAPKFFFSREDADA